MLKLGATFLERHLLIGSAQYPSPQVMTDAIRASKAQVVTVSLRRQAPESSGGDAFWQILKELDLHILPNTAGSKTAREAVNTACMAREIFKTNWIKLEVIGDDYNLLPDPYGLLDAATELIKDGFEVFPYTSPDFVVATKLAEKGCSIIMPYASPIGTGKGIADLDAIKTLRMRLKDITLILDAGLGLPSHAAQAMELGYDGVLVNSAIALAHNPIAMAEAFGQAVEAGLTAYKAGPMPARDTASPSTPVSGTPFWHQFVEQVKLNG